MQENWFHSLVIWCPRVQSPKHSKFKFTAYFSRTKSFQSTSYDFCFIYLYIHFLSVPSNKSTNTTLYDRVQMKLDRNAKYLANAKQATSPGTQVNPQLLAPPGISWRRTTHSRPCSLPLSLSIFLCLSCGGLQGDLPRSTTTSRSSCPPLMVVILSGCRLLSEELWCKNKYETK